MTDLLERSSKLEEQLRVMGESVLLNGVSRVDIPHIADTLRDLRAEVVASREVSHISQTSRRLAEEENDSLRNERDAALARVDELELEVAGWRRKAEVALNLFGDTQREVDAMRPVVEAAERWKEFGPVNAGIGKALDEYRARKP